MCGMSNTRKVTILAYSKLGLMVVFTLLFLIAISIIGVYYHELEQKMVGLNRRIITVVVAFIVTMLFEAALLILLFKAIKERSYKKCQIWFVICGIVFAVSLVSFIIEAFAVWPLSLIGTLLELVYDGCSLKIVYDFMMEIRVTPTGDVPFEEMKNETV